jgi:3-oxochol-4-en-24-oyl-CoA dehydrogenase
LCSTPPATRCCRVRYCPPSSPGPWSPPASRLLAVKLDKEAELRALAAQPRPDQWAVRQALGEIRAESNAIGALAVRDTLSRLAGREPGPASSAAKVATALFVRRVTAHALQFSGRSALVSDADQAAVAQSLLMPAELIGGGTVEIQLNIIATLVLGLPRS